MSVIKFSHLYKKMPPGVLTTESLVVGVDVLDYSQLTPEEIEKDTAIVGGGHYQLPKTKLIHIRLRTEVLEHGVLTVPEWGTLRRYTPQKFEYYSGLLNESVQIMIVPPKTDKEIVICAAVKATNGKAYRGHRHGDCMHAIITRGLKISDARDSQGFITSKNRYVTREVGRKLQEAAGIPSADPEGYRGTTLFSEDLY